jgi:predicted DNA-binding ribbon-helix-helix protein
MKSSIVKRSVVIGRHKTSVSLEEPFWTALKQIAHARHMSLSALVAEIDCTREQSNLSSAIRLFVLRHSRLAEWPSDPSDPSGPVARTRPRGERNEL